MGEIRENWNFRCDKAIRRERAEAERKYNIKIGQTTIHCCRCGNSVASPDVHAKGDCRESVAPIGKRDHAKSARMRYNETFQ